MQSDEQAIRQLVETWLDATKRGDLESILPLMSEDVVFLTTGQAIMYKKDFAAASQALQGQAVEQIPKIEIQSEIQEIKVLGDWAFMRTQLTVTMTPAGDGPTLVRSGHTLSILKKEAGHWVLLRDANMLAPVNADTESLTDVTF